MFCGGVIAGHGSAGLIAAVAFVSVMFSPISAVGHLMLEFLYLLAFATAEEDLAYFENAPSSKA